MTTVKITIDEYFHIQQSIHTNNDKSSYDCPPDLVNLDYNTL